MKSIALLLLLVGLSCSSKLRLRENFFQNFRDQQFPSRLSLLPPGLSSRLSPLNARAEAEGARESALLRLCQRFTGRARVFCILRFGESQPRPSQQPPTILPGQGSLSQLIRFILNRIRGGGESLSVVPTTEIRGGGESTSVVPTTEGPETEGPETEGQPTPSSPAPTVSTDLPPQDRDGQDLISKLIDIINLMKEGEEDQSEAPTTEAPTVVSPELEELSEEEALQELEKVLSGIN